MPIQHFHVIMQICRNGLASARSPDLRRHVSLLRNVLARESRDGKNPDFRATAREQAVALTELLDSHRPPGQRFADLGDLPTPETVAQLKQDSILTMLRRGSLEREHQMAADEIRDIYQALVSGMTAKSLPLDRVKATLDKLHQTRQPLERMPERLARLYHDHYRPWSAEMERARYGAKTYLELTIDVVVDGRSLHEVERGQNLRNGSASKALRRSLTRYAEIAGWVRMERPPCGPRKIPAKTVPPVPKHRISKGKTVHDA